MASRMEINISPDQVLEYVSDRFGVEVEDIVGSGRSAQVSKARHIAMYLIRELTELSFPNIGAYFGKDHTSVIYAWNKIRNSTAKDPGLKRSVDKMVRDIKKSSYR